MNKLKVLIDLDRLKDPYNGLGQVALNLAEHLSKREDPELEFTFLVPDAYLGKFGDKVKYEVISLKRRFLPWLCQAYDLWYTIHQDSWYFPSSKHTPYVLTINDLNFLGEKQGFNRKYRLKRLQLKVNRAKLVTAISHYTAQDITKNLSTHRTDLRVIYSGVKVNRFENPSKPDFVPEGDILFTVGVIQPKKNFAVLVEFLEKLPSGYSLVIAGNDHSEYAGQIRKTIAAKSLERRIILPGKISDEHKFWLYENCRAVVFPSRFEGMGFPPVEAMASGKPVFASTMSSIPEVCGEFAYYWENFEPDHMAEVFMKGMDDFDQNPERPGQLKKHASRYEWEKVTEEYVNLFKEILKIKTT
jgi:glycosyltransferase involved in cell wall biosynthesis